MRAGTLLNSLQCTHTTPTAENGLVPDAEVGKRILGT